ncbi:MAG: hypothetical protein WAU39_18185 [Polyangiales bacterium]
MQSPVDQQSVAADWRSRGFSCDLWVDPPGQVWADYVHEVDELVMVVVVEEEDQERRISCSPPPGPRRA